MMERDEDADSSSEFPCSRDIRKKMKSRNSSRHQIDSDSDSDIRSSWRKPNSQETIEMVIYQRLGKRNATGDSTIQYNVEQNGDPNADFDPNDPKNTEIQYLIKWENWAHIHNTWESKNSLNDKKSLGMAIFNKFVEDENEFALKKSHATAEECKHFDSQMEIQYKLLKSHANVDRIIAQVADDQGILDFLIKWENLPYCDSTEEDDELIRRMFPLKVEEFERRENSKDIPNAHCKFLKKRPTFRNVSYRNVHRVQELTRCQLNGLKRLIESWCKKDSETLPYEWGHGNIIKTISFIYYLYETYHLFGPFIVIVPPSRIEDWEKLFRKWAPNMNIVTYFGDAVSLEKIRKFELLTKTNSLKFNTIMTTFVMTTSFDTTLLDVKWAVMIIDDNQTNIEKYVRLGKFDYNFRIFISGSPNNY